MWQLMPSRNVLKLDLAESYYHVYARGNSRQEIFLKEDDYLHFLNVFRRYLCDEEVKTQPVYHTKSWATA
jgi:hypothetical protein